MLGARVYRLRQRFRQSRSFAPQRPVPWLAIRQSLCAARHAAAQAFAVFVDSVFVSVRSVIKSNMPAWAGAVPNDNPKNTKLIMSARSATLVSMPRPISFYHQNTPKIPRFRVRDNIRELDELGPELGSQQPKTKLPKHHRLNSKPRKKGGRLKDEPPQRWVKWTAPQGP